MERHFKAPKKTASDPSLPGSGQHEEAHVRAPTIQPMMHCVRFSAMRRIDMFKGAQKFKLLSSRQQTEAAAQGTQKAPLALSVCDLCCLACQ